MRLVIARCSVDYQGRLAAHLPEAIRLIMVKADGCVAIHSDGGAYKPLNWMNAPNTLVTGEDFWTVTNPKGETLVISLNEVFSDSSQEFGVDPGLQKDGVEAHLQELLAASPHAIEVGLVLVRREYPTAIGPIDLVCRAGDGQVVAVEVKRRGLSLVVSVAGGWLTDDGASFGAASTGNGGFSGLPSLASVPL